MGTSELNLSGLEYTVVRSRRRTMALIVHADNRLEIRCGPRTPRAEIDRFVLDKQHWIQRKFHENEALVTITAGEETQAARLRHNTRQQVEAVLAHHTDLTPAKVSIRRQKRRWGSCSKRGCITINLCASLLPQELMEYIVVHELCHLIHFDHSSRFYELLKRRLPDARERQRQLKRYLLV